MAGEKYLISEPSTIEGFSANLDGLRLTITGNLKTVSNFAMLPKLALESDVTDFTLDKVITDINAYHLYDNQLDNPLSPGTKENLVSQIVTGKPQG
jgi:hypothetical protein